MREFVEQPAVCVSVSGQRLPQPDDRAPFVINLLSSSSPAAFSLPQRPELAQYTFFMSRRREDGRDRFRFHLGFFATRQDAEAVLEAVRANWPGAWVGVGPGSQLPEAVAHAAEPGTHTDTGSEPVPVPVQAPLPVQAPQAVELSILEESLSSVRAAIAALGETEQPEAQHAETLSPAEALALLEDAAATEARPRAAGAKPTPDNVAAYAVQLRWSTQPISLSDVPQLAIFDAYMLYRATGRELFNPWHALRLGFFPDAVSAEQVVSYIRADFAEATVVPVGRAERDTATAATAQPRHREEQADAGSAEGAAAAHAAEAAGDGLASIEFRLIDDAARPARESERLDLLLTTDLAAGSPPAKLAAASGGKPGTRRPPAIREEALDELGAGRLKLEGAAGERLDASALSSLRHAAERKPPARSSLSRLFSRLAGSPGGER